MRTVSAALALVGVAGPADLADAARLEEQAALGAREAVARDLRLEPAPLDRISRHGRTPLVVPAVLPNTHGSMVAHAAPGLFLGPGAVLRSALMHQGGMR